MKVLNEYVLGKRGWRHKAFSDLREGRPLTLVATGWRRNALRRIVKRRGANEPTEAIDLALAIALPVAHVICGGAIALGRTLVIDSDTDDVLVVKIGSSE